MALTEKLEELVTDLAAIDDVHERLGLIVDRAKRVPPLPALLRIESHRVRGCVSVVWLVGELRDGHCFFQADAESPLVRGLVILLAEFFSDFPPAALATTDVDPIEGLKLSHNLSPTRRNGLNATREAIRDYARRHLAETVTGT